MELELGRHTFDVATRAVIVAAVNQGTTALQDAASLIEQGAEVIEIHGEGDELVSTVAQLVAQLDVPVSIDAGQTRVIEEAFAVGLTIARGGGPEQDQLRLPFVARSGGSVIFSSPMKSAVDSEQPEIATTAAVNQLAERLDRVQPTGLAARHVILNAPVRMLAQLNQTDATLMFTAEPGPGAQGEHVAAVMAGARILATNDVRATRRTADTISELLKRRGVSAPDAVTLTGVG